MADVDRPQGHRPQLHDHRDRHLLRVGDHGARHATAARLAALLAAELRAIQRAVHHARQPDAVPVRRALRLRWPGQLHRAAADRRAGHGLPAPQRAELLALPDRLHHHAPRLLRGRRRGTVRLGGLRAALERHQLARSGTRCLDHGSRAHRLLGHLHRRQPVRDDLLPARPGHDHVPHAHLHLEHAGDRDPHPHRLPGAHGGSDHALLRPPLRDTHLHRRGLPSGERSAHGLVRVPVVMAKPLLVLRPSRGLYPRAARSSAS